MRSRLPGSRSLALAACLLGAPALGAQTAAAPSASATASTTPAARPADVVSIDAILSALYEVISGPAGPRDWDRFRSLFIPGGRLIPTRPGQNGAPATASVATPDEYAARAGQYFTTSGFFEREVARRMERFGAVAQVFSTYESRHAAADARPFARGINSIQLFWDGTRWWVVTIFWDAERPGNAIPPEYLPGGSAR